MDQVVFGRSTIELCGAGAADEAAIAGLRPPLFEDGDRGGCTLELVGDVSMTLPSVFDVCRSASKRFSLARRTEPMDGNRPESDSRMSLGDICRCCPGDACPFGLDMASDSDVGTGEGCAVAICAGSALLNDSRGFAYGRESELPTATWSAARCTLVVAFEGGCTVNAGTC